MPELPLPPPSPQFGQLVPLFLDVKNDVLARITEQSKDDYDNDVSDNCDHNFGTFDDFGVKNDQKVSNNMILMSKYKGKHGGKKGQKIRAWVDPPPSFGQCPKENVFFLLMSSLSPCPCDPLTLYLRHHGKTFLMLYFNYFLFLQIEFQLVDIVQALKGLGLPD